MVCQSHTASLGLNKARLVTPLIITLNPPGLLSYGL